MELLPLADVVLDRVSEELLGDVSETAERINVLRPLPAEMIRTIQLELVGDRVYSSNAIEGNTLSLGETRHILETGYIEIAGRKREATEVVNLGNAIEFAKNNLVDQSAPYSVENLLETHRLILKGINDSIAGSLRHERVRITGARHQPPSERYVADLIDKLIGELSAEYDGNPIVKASWAHWALARIHPFFDGNGRTARLWQDVILFRSGLTCAVIPPEIKTEYLRCLVLADDGDLNPLIQLVAQQVAATFDKYLALELKADSVSQWARGLAGESEARVEEERRLAYLRWQRKMSELQYEFQHCASAITNAATQLEVQLRAYPGVDQSGWENIRSNIRVAKTWLFILSFQRSGVHWSYIFFFGKHFWSDADDDRDIAEARVALQVAEQSGRAHAGRIADPTTTPITFREVIVVDDYFVRKRFDAETQSEVYDRSIDASRIAQEFITEALLTRLS